MTLIATKATTGYVVEGTDVAGKAVELFFDSSETAQYDRLVEAEENFTKAKAFAEAKAKLPDPERDLYITFFGKDDEPVDKALHTTLVKVKEARDGISLDWTGSPVTVALRLIAKGQSDRLRLIGDRLVDMGPGPAAPSAPATAQSFTD